MLAIDSTRLNPYERSVLERLSTYAESNPPPRIVDAAAFCGCSVSLISKMIKKAGFNGYKQYLHHLYNQKKPEHYLKEELERIRHVIDVFNPSLVDEFVNLIIQHDKIVLFGYGPSHIAVKYFEYKLQFCIEAFVAAPHDENSVRDMLNKTSLLAIFSTTGQYKSFEELSNYAHTCGAAVVIVSEEFNPSLLQNCDRYMVLSHYNQPEHLKPHEKTRTVFFLFMEAVIKRLLLVQQEKAGSV